MEERLDELTEQKKSLSEELYDTRRQHQELSGGNNIFEKRIASLEKQVAEKEAKLKLVEKLYEDSAQKVSDLNPKVGILEEEIEQEKESLKSVQEKYDESVKLIQ